MQIRNYQSKHISEIVDAIEMHRTVLAQLPTGGGKTVEFSLIIKDFLHRKINIEVGPVLILVHREELLHQAAKCVKEILGFDPCLITSDTDRFWIARVYIGMVTSTMHRLDMIKEPSLIIVDEAHLQDFIKVHAKFPDCKFIAFTATPLSASKRTPLLKYYDEIVCGPSIKTLINDGYLAQNLTRAPKNSINPSSFGYDRLIDDYNQRNMFQAFSMSSNIENCLNQYWKYCKGKKTLIFNVNIEHSKQVNSLFNACRIPSKHLDANSTDRKEIFEWFKITPNAVLNSVMIPTMGFDEPTVQSVILNYSTLSLVKFIQTCGRGSRIIDEYFIEKHHAEYPYELKLKTHFDIIDLGQNWKNFGDWNDERDWSFIFWHPDMPGDGVAPVKTCPECESLVHAAVRLCPHCGHKFKKKVHKQQDMEEMILITKGIDINKVLERGERKYKYYPFFEMAVDVVDNMFYQHGYNPSKMIVDRYFRTYYELCCQWFDKALAGKDGELDDIVDSHWHITKAKNNFNLLIQKRNRSAIIVGNDTKKILNPTKSEEEETNWNNFKQANNWNLDENLAI